MSAGNGLAWDRLGIGVLDGEGRFLNEVQRHVSGPCARHGSQVVCDDFEWLEEEEVLPEGIIQIGHQVGSGRGLWKCQSKRNRETVKDCCWAGFANRVAVRRHGVRRLVEVEVQAKVIAPSPSARDGKHLRESYGCRGWSLPLLPSCDNLTDTPL